jgi:DNA polymerase
MTVRSSLDLDQNLRLISTKNCQACGLYRNQLPLFDDIQYAQVFWVGLSAVQIMGCHKGQPLSPETKSGALIEEIEKPLTNQLAFYKTNLVKCLPLNNGSIRYPKQGEMKKCSSKFDMELRALNPSLVFLLGKQVASFVFKRYLNKEAELDKTFNYQPHLYNGMYFVPVHHPSYMLIYKRKYMNDYIYGIRSLCERL